MLYFTCLGPETSVLPGGFGLGPSRLTCMCPVTGSPWGYVLRIMTKYVSYPAVYRPAVFTLHVHVAHGKFVGLVKLQMVYWIRISSLRRDSYRALKLPSQGYSVPFGSSGRKRPLCPPQWPGRFRFPWRASFEVATTDVVQGGTLRIGEPVGVRVLAAARTRPHSQTECCL